jgi:diguanylate cyclase (GGDEF)-like protein
VKSGDRFWLEDLGSANGTFVAGERIERKVLNDGDLIQFGPRVEFRFSVTDAAQEQVLRQLYEASVKDSLTGAYNREFLGERLRSEVAFSRRHGTDTSLVLIYVDHFKRVNDTFGHQAGDAVLVELVRLFTDGLRTEDTFARYGGEEFAISLRGIGLQDAARVADRLRAAVAARPIQHMEHAIRCTVSAGCSSVSCCVEPSVEELVAIADRRLYAAKGAGRNRVVAAG